MEELKEKYALKKEEMREKYAEVVNKIAIAKGVDVGVAFDMLLAVARGGDYLEGVELDEPFDYDALNVDYFELASISLEIAKLNGIVD